MSKILPNTIKLYTAALLALFNKVKIQQTLPPYKTQQLPVVYANREEIFEVKGFSFDDLFKNNAITPRGLLAIESLSFDNQRTKNVRQEKFKTISKNHTHLALMNGVPYNIEYTLSIFTSNLSDATVIIEQICNKFNPFLKTGIISIDVGLGVIFPEVELSTVSISHPEDDASTQVDIGLTVYGEMFGVFEQVQEIDKIIFKIKVEDEITEMQI